MVRHIAEWDSKRSGKDLSRLETLAMVLSLGAFMLYFLWLREPSNIDEYMSRPIWQRLPGIDPERAQQMMEMDKHLGLQVDYKELNKYKEEYYAKQQLLMEQEQQAEQHHRQLRQAYASHADMLNKYAQKPQGTQP